MRNSQTLPAGFEPAIYRLTADRLKPDLAMEEVKGVYTFVYKITKHFFCHKLNARA
jgi:hypothetical protein